jgi:hypothetical protein
LVDDQDLEIREEQMYRREPRQSRSPTVIAYYIPAPHSPYHDNDANPGPSAYHSSEEQQQKEASCEA